MPPKELVILREMLPSLQLVYNEGVPYPEKYYQQTDRRQGWNSMGGTGAGSLDNQFWYFQDEIDVSGWGVKGETFYPTGFTTHSGLRTQAFEGGFLTETVLISQSPFDVRNYVEAAVSDDNTLDLILPALDNRRTNTGFIPMNNQPLDYEDVLGGSARLMAGSTTLPSTLYVTLNEQNFSSLEPTATDRLYVTRLIRFQNNEATPYPVGVMVIPACRVILSGIPVVESKLSYIMRLKNSFKLTQTDVGLI
jgi:hypothetical protein